MNIAFMEDLLTDKIILSTSINVQLHAMGFRKWIKELVKKWLLFSLFFFILLAILNIFFPAMGWHMRYGWMVKGDSGPSEAYLIMSRITSVIVLIIFFSCSFFAFDVWLGG
ncbi:DUF6199 family natural product biosynthesis protein [Paenibacillus rhizoplanae]